jgi:hypothetical protein
MRRMNGFVRVCLTDIERIIGSIGSGDEELFARIIEQNRAYFAEDAADREPGSLTEHDAVRMLIHATPGSYQWQQVHNCAFETIMDTFDGRWLADIEHGRLEQIGTALAQLHIDAVYAGDLMCGTPWTNTDCRRAWAQWRAATPEQRARADPAVLAAVDEWMRWVHEAASTTHLGLLGALWWG